METSLTVSELLGAMKQLAPVLGGMWAILSVLLGAVVVGAVWVTKISTAVKNHAAQLKESQGSINSERCESHRAECDRRHSIEYAGMALTLVEIKEAIVKINERHERYQEALLRGAQNGN